MVLYYSTCGIAIMRTGLVVLRAFAIAPLEHGLGRLLGLGLSVSIARQLDRRAEVGQVTAQTAARFLPRLLLA